MQGINAEPLTAGLWQGGIFLPKFIISLFLDNVKFIAKNRTLGYDIAFFFVNIVSLFYFIAVIIKSKREKLWCFSLFDLMILCLIIHTLPTFFERFQPHKSKYFAIFIASKSIMYENRQHTMFITRQAHAPHLGVKMKMLQISADTNNRFNQFPLLQKALTKL